MHDSRGPAAAGRRATRERQALRALLLGLGLFALANACLTGLLRARLVWCHDPYYAPRLTCLRQRTRQAERPCTVVMVGSSRVGQALRAAALERQLSEALGRPAVAFNLGLPGAGPVNLLNTWRRLRQEGIRPDLLLVEATHFLYAGAKGHDELNEVQLPTTALEWQDLAFVARYDPSRARQRRHEWVRNQFAPWLGYRRPLLSRLGPWLLARAGRDPTPPLLNPSGDGPPVLVIESLEARHQRARAYAAERLSWFNGPMPAPREAAALRELLQECRDHHVPVLLVLMPEATTLRHAWPVARVRQFEQFLRATARDHAAGVVDARDWISDEAFTDGIHALPGGAEQFTGRLAHEAILPWLRARR